MRRIKYACLEQTIHFLLNEDLEDSIAKKAVQDEFAAYKAKLDRSKVTYKITDETTLPNGSLMVKIKRQYNSYDCGDYLD
ncbi:MAG: hypothetical protein Q4E24_14850 [bacterium]|nr:hypothetical protein [bacterium]